MPFLFYPDKRLETVGVILALAALLNLGDAQAEEIARLSGSESPANGSKVISPGYELQLNSFKVESNAKRFLAGLIKKGYEPFIMSVHNGETWFKVRMGPYPSKENARRIAAQLKNKHDLSSLLVWSGKIPQKKEIAVKLTAKKVAPENTGNSIDVVMSQFLVWLEAWQGKQLDAYFSFYSQSFESGGKPFADWLKEQSKTLDATQQIKVEVNDLELLEKGDTIEMSFMENFQSESFSDIRRKVLVWKKENGVWKIIVESSEPA